MYIYISLKLRPRDLVHKVPWHSIQDVAQILNGLEQRQIHPQHRDANVMQLLYMTCMHLADFIQTRMPIGHLQEVTGAAAAISDINASTATTPAWRSHIAVFHHLTLHMMKVFRACLVPAPGTSQSAVSKEATIPTHAWGQILDLRILGRSAGSGDMIDDEIDNHLVQTSKQMTYGHIKTLL